MVETLRGQLARAREGDASARRKASGTAGHGEMRGRGGEGRGGGGASKGERVCREAGAEAGARWREASAGPRRRGGYALA